MAAVFVQPLIPVTTFGLGVLLAVECGQRIKDLGNGLIRDVASRNGIDHRLESSVTLGTGAHLSEGNLSHGFYEHAGY